MHKQLMLPTDGSELSEPAARDGVCFAQSLGAQRVVLHTTPLFYPFELQHTPLLKVRWNTNSSGLWNAAPLIKVSIGS